MAAQIQIIYAPSTEEARHRNTVFLAGSTSGRDWRKELCQSWTAAAATAITVYNPMRPDWAALVPEDISNPSFRAQVEWELSRQERARLVAVYLAAGTDAPISLMELGLSAAGAGAGPKPKVIVCAEKNYSKRGNVQVVCHRYRIELVDNLEGLKAGIEKMLLV
ncbi:hypothetical protein BX600DRAFT_436432 [Xylariales sp. PMI_506]|nr:hypothetical protein BX600DRAFT_436432 [Xylariales sp. PMI_506]